MSSETSWFHTRGDLRRGQWESVVDASLAGWEHTGLQIAELSDGDELTLDDTHVERIIVPLSGSFAVEHSDGDDWRRTDLQGRVSVFDGPSDVLYVPCTSRVRVTGTGRVAVASSPTKEKRTVTYISASHTPVEIRGAGVASRQVHNFGTPDTLDAARLVVCEVITPAGNWSSYPPHKHDQSVPGVESELEEIYYFEAAPTSAAAPSPEAAFGMFSTYSSPAGAIDINARVRTGDIALVPYGYHGPAVAAPGYDLYYLNVMAGPDPERAWRISDDPAHAWVRGDWETQAADARLPLNRKDTSR